MGFLWEYVYYRIVDLSSLSDYEYVSIVSNYNNVDQTDEEQALKDRGYSENQIKHVLKNKQGSSFKSLNVVFHNSKKINYPYFTYIITLFNQYKLGVLPFNGCLVDQPAKIIEIFDLLYQLQFEHEDKTRKKLEKENNKRG